MIIELTIKTIKDDENNTCKIWKENGVVNFERSILHPSIIISVPSIPSWEVRKGFTICNLSIV